MSKHCQIVKHIFLNEIVQIFEKKLSKLILNDFINTKLHYYFTFFTR